MDVNGVFGICTQGRALLTHHVRKRVHYTLHCSMGVQ